MDDACALLDQPVELRNGFIGIGQRKHGNGNEPITVVIAPVVLEPAVEVGQMVLHHFTHSQQVLLREDVNEILAGNGRGITSTAIGDAKHKLMACKLTVTLVKG